MTTAPEGAYADASEAKFNAWRSIPSTFVSIAAFRFPDMTLAAGDRLESIFAGEVTPEFFQLFGARTQVGRTFTEAEGRPGAEKVAVISDGLWARRFNAELRLDRRCDSTAARMSSSGFCSQDSIRQHSQVRSSPGADVWVPLQIDPTSTTLEAQFVVAGRLLPSVSLAEAQSRVAAAAGDLYRRFPAYVRAGDGATVEPLQKILGTPRSVPVARPAWRRLFGAADCVREPCQPTAGARSGTHTRSRAACCPGRDAGPDRSATHHGERRPRRDRRSGRIRRWVAWPSTRWWDGQDRRLHGLVSRGMVSQWTRGS